MVLWTNGGTGRMIETVSQPTVHTMKTIVLIISVSVVLAGLAGTEAAPASPPKAAPAPHSADATDAPDGPAKAAVIANDRAYEAAFAKGDAKAMAAFFADDAEYTAADGRAFNGREAIDEALRAATAANKGATLAIAVDSVRVLTPDVVAEKGVSTVTAKNGESNSAQYTAIHVKKDGKWKISELVETPLATATPHDRLAELEWLIGTWEEADKATDLSVRSKYEWARGGSFITRNVTVKRGGETALEGWQIIGWDPTDDRLRSWTFDSEGGFSEAVWTREGDRWLMRETGVTPDGSRTAGDNTITKVGADRCTWDSNNRTLDGEPQPSIGRIEIQRVKGD